MPALPHTWGRGHLPKPVASVLEEPRKGTCPPALFSSVWLSCFAFRSAPDLVTLRVRVAPSGLEWLNRMTVPIIGRKLSTTSLP